jgi:hypothetical protein
MVRAFSAGNDHENRDTIDTAVWSHYDMRRRWNQVKAEVAPWWAECSKEAYSNGIADAVTALKNWQASRVGNREGPRTGFHAAQGDHRSGQDPRPDRDRRSAASRPAAWRWRFAEVVVGLGGGRVSSSTHVQVRLVRQRTVDRRSLVPLKQDVLILRVRLAAVKRVNHPGRMAA